MPCSCLVTITDRASTPNRLNPGDPGSSIAIQTTAGKIRRHRYNTGGGVLVSDLTNNFRFPDFPDEVTFPTLFEDTTPTGDGDNNFGVQLVGYVTAPISGNYNFYMSSDDGGVLFLSTDESPANRRLIAFEPVWNGSRDWTGTTRRNAAAPENRSTTLFPSGIPLVAGERYFIEALMKEGGGGNFLAVAWQKPGDPVPPNGSSPIPSLFLDPFNVPPAIAADQPADQRVPENRQVTLSAVATGSPFLSFQWYENDMPVAGAEGRAFANHPILFTIGRLTIADSGKTFYVVVTNDVGAVTSRVATVMVDVDSTPPMLVSAASLNGSDVGLCFSEELNPATATDPANYTVSGGATVGSATLRYDGRTVALLLSGNIASGATVTVNNVRDLNNNTIAASSSATVNVAELTPTDIGTPDDPIVPGSSFTCRDGEFELIAGGSDVWGNADHGHFAYQAIAGNFDKQVKVARVDGTDPSAKGGLMVRESLAAGSRNLHAIVMPPPIAPPFLLPPTFGRNIFETGRRAATDGATAGWGIAGGANGNLPATHPNSWIRLRRIGTIWKAYVSSNGVDWVQNGQSEQVYPDSVFFLLEATAHNNDGRTNRVLFQNLSDTVIPGASVAITEQPQDVSIDANHAVSFGVAATVSGVSASEIGYQWQRSDGAGGFTNIYTPGANAPTYMQVVTLADNDAQFRAVVSVPGASATSSAATLTVTNDVTPPRIALASRGLSLTTVTVVFNELVDRTSASDFTFNYMIKTADGESVPSGGMVLSDGRTVVLQSSVPLMDGGFHLLTVNGVADLAGNATANERALIRILSGPIQAIGSQVVIEAENFDNTVAQGSPVHMWVFSDVAAGTGNFSGTGYMQAQPETGAAVNEPGHVTGAPRLDYRVNFPAGGTWLVWLRGNDVTGGGNSVHVGINNADSPEPNDNRIGNSGGATGWGNPAGANSPWQWTRDADVNTRVARVTVPSAGLHTFNVWMREDSVIVDKIFLTTDANFVFSPNTVIGPDETPRADNTPAARLNISRSDGNVTITWNVPAGIGGLQRADTIVETVVMGRWVRVADADPSGYTVPASAAASFYRLIIP